jgi:hypothetical protein
VVGSSLSFTFRAKDAYGNSISTGPQNFSLSFAPATPTTLSITDNGDGTAGAAYSFNTAGTYTARLLLGGVELTSSPVNNVVISPGGHLRPAKTCTRKNAL